MNQTIDSSSKRSILHGKQFLLGALTIFLFSCGGGGGDDPTPPANGTQPMDKMSRALTITGIPADGEITRSVGSDPFTITITISAGTGAITYTSSDPAVATIDGATGEVTLLTVGTTTITATLAADDRYNEATASFTLTVEAAAPSIPIIPATQSATAIHTTPLIEAIVIENTGAALADDGCQFVDAADSTTTTTNTAGLSIAVSGNNCHITGTPRRSDQATAGTPQVIMLFIRAFNAEGSDWTTLALTINPTPPDLGNLADSLELTLDTPTPTITFANASDGIVSSNGCDISPALPAGLTLAPTSDSQSCQITGTPTQTLATTTYTITASDGITPDPTPARLTLAVRLPSMQIQTGDEHSCLLNPTGEIWCWGNNTNGQLGAGDNFSRERPTRVGAETNWRSLTVGSDHNCAINASAQLYCWGAGSFGQLGQGMDDEGEEIKDDQNTPTQVSMRTDWHSVAAGIEHTCGIRGNDTNRTLWCWGNGRNGRLGTGNTDDQNAPTQEEGEYTDWHSVSAGNTHTCGIRKDGADQTLWCWGEGSAGQLGTPGSANENSPTQVAGMHKDWQSVSVGNAHTCGIRDDGTDKTLRCWGSGVAGRLGTGSTSISATPAQEAGMRTDWQSVSAGDNHTCGIRDEGADQTLWCWGGGSSGRLGIVDSATNQPPVRQTTPGPVGTNKDWRSVSVGRAHTCGIRGDGAAQTLWCWGSGTFGRFGTDSITNKNTSTRVDSATTDWHSVSAGARHTCGIREDGADRTLWCWGLGVNGQLGGGDSNNRNIPTQAGVEQTGTQMSTRTNWHSVSAGDSHTCGIRDDDTNQTLWCWGEGSLGRLGTGNTDDQDTPTQEAGGHTDWLTVSVGNLHTCGIRGDGADQTLWCWGSGSNGRLGVLADNGRLIVLQSSPIRVDKNGDADWQSVSAGGSHTCGIRGNDTNRTLYCWGEGGLGKLGTGNSDDKNTPTQEAGSYTGWLTVSAGNTHTCGIRKDSADQTLWCWGQGTSGQLGAGNSDDKNTPTQEAGAYTDWQSVSAGKGHTCGVRGEGANRTLWCWGSGNDGQLGAGSFTSRLIPRPVPGLTTPSLVDAGNIHTCAVDTANSNNSLFCWGDVSDGRLGIGDVANFASAPRRILFAIESLVTPTALADALDTTEIAFNLLGTHSWMAQTEQTNDDTDAAAATATTEDDLACITSFAEDAGTLSFYWRVSSEMDSDFLKFYLDAFESQSISGMVDWVQVDAIDVLEDSELRWCYEKDDNDMTANEDGAFLDQVVFTPR